MSSLRDFLKQITDETVHIEEPLSVRYDVSAALRRFDGGKAVYVHATKPQGTPVVGGVSGNRSRIFKALNTKAENLYTTLTDATHQELRGNPHLPLLQGFQTVINQCPLVSPNAGGC